MMRGSSYLGSTPRSALGRPRRFGSLAAIFLVFAVLLSGFASIPLIDSLTRSATPQGDSTASVALVSDASAMWCADPKEGNLGLGMDNRSDWRSGSAWYPHANTSGRILTTQEAFSNGVQFTNFNGVGESPGLPWFFMSPSPGLPQSENDAETGLNSVVSYTGNSPEGEGAENWYKNMNSSRTPTKCVMGAVGASVANGILGITTGITNLMGGIATFAFDPGFICEPNSGAANCIDLVGIIGGSGRSSSDGLIGQLTTSVYFPLLALAALLVGIYIIWNGIAKRKFRETFLGVIWSVVVVILGIAMLLNPLMLAKAPMVASNALASCIIGAFSGGGGCADTNGGTGAGATDGPTEFCEAWSNKRDFVDQAAITMTSMSCELWRSFVLQPYAQGSFGASLDQLDTNRPGTVASKLIERSPGFRADPTTFCVDTKVRGTLEDNYGKTLELTRSGAPICNLAVYQAFLGVDAKMDSGAGGNPAPAAAIDGRWLKLAQVAASDEGMYRSWAPSDWHLSQIGFASIGLLSAALAAIVVFVVSAFALAFYVTSILMIAFAPFFLLAGVHPGRGRKMMVGWIGQVLSNIMKYAASAIFLVITVALYGAVLSNVSNPGAILIFMIILTVALLMYRREIVDMIGVIDLGGEKLSNKFAERVSDRVRNTGKTAMAVGAGVTAGALSNGSLNPFRVDNWKPENFGRNIGENLRAGVDAGRRSIKSRPGAIGEVMKASDRISADNRSDMAKKSGAALETARRATQDRVGQEKTRDQLTNELESSRATTENQLQELEERNSTAMSRQFGAQSELEKVGGAQSAALDAISSPVFKQYQDLLNQISDLEMKITIAEESGDLEGAEAYRNQSDILRGQLTSVESQLTQEEYSVGDSEYRTALAEALDDPRVNAENAHRYEDHVRREYQGIMSTIGGTAAKAEQLKAQQEAAEVELTAAIAAAEQGVADATLTESTAQSAADMARQRIVDLKPGQVVKNTDVRKYTRDIKAMQEDRSQVVGGVVDLMDASVVEGAESHVEATDIRDAWRQEAAVQREGLTAARAEAGQIDGVRNEFVSAQRSAAESWKNESAETPEDKAKNAYIIRTDAEEKIAAANARAEAIAAKESNADALSERDRSDIFIAQKEAEKAQEVVDRSDRVIRSAGVSVEDLKKEFNSAVEKEYSKSPAASKVQIDGGVENFQADLEKAAAEVQAEIARREANIANAQANSAAAAKRAEEIQRETQRFASEADKLRKRAESSKPISATEADKLLSGSAKRAEHFEEATRDRSNSRGIPRTPEAAPQQPVEDRAASNDRPATPAPQRPAESAPQRQRRGLPVTPEPKSEPEARNDSGPSDDEPPRGGTPVSPRPPVTPRDPSGGGAARPERATQTQEAAPSRRESAESRPSTVEREAPRQSTARPEPSRSEPAKSQDPRQEPRQPEAPRPEPRQPEAPRPEPRRERPSRSEQTVERGAPRQGTTRPEPENRNDPGPSDDEPPRGGTPVSPRPPVTPRDPSGGGAARPEPSRSEPAKSESPRPEPRQPEAPRQQPRQERPSRSEQRRSARSGIPRDTESTQPQRDVSAARRAVDPRLQAEPNPRPAPSQPQQGQENPVAAPQSGEQNPAISDLTVNTPTADNGNQFRGGIPFKRGGDTPRRR